MTEDELVAAELRAIRRGWKLIELRQLWIRVRRRRAGMALWWRYHPPAKRKV